MDLIWRKTKAQATTSGLNPQPAYLALAAAFCATSSPQLNHGQVDLNEVLVHGVLCVEIVNRC